MLEEIILFNTSYCKNLCIISNKSLSGVLKRNENSLSKVIPSLHCSLMSSDSDSEGEYFQNFLLFLLGFFSPHGKKEL